MDRKHRNSAGTSANSAQVSAKPQLPVPATPAGLAATPGNAQVALSWTASPGATSYVLSRQTMSGGAATPTSTYVPIATISSASYVDTYVINGSPYAYVVAAANAAGQSAASAAVDATPMAGASAPLSRIQAARFLAQASFGGSDTDIQNSAESGEWHAGLAHGAVCDAGQSVGTVVECRVDDDQRSHLDPVRYHRRAKLVLAQADWRARTCCASA
jgi:hypothetical protein